MSLAGACRGRWVSTYQKPVMAPLSALRRPSLFHAPSQARVSLVRRSAAAYGADGEGPQDYSKVADQLNKLLVKSEITAEELRQLVYEKWGRTYEVRLQKLGKQMYLQVMWKFLEQQSFHLSEEEYMMQLDAVAHFINEWGVAEMVRSGIRSARSRGPGYTGGGNARCISIPLDVDISGRRSSEWD